LTASVKAIFSKAPGRRARYLHHLRQKNVQKVIMPPSPVITRWNSWFEAVLHHGEYLDHYITFLPIEIENAGNTIQLSKLEAMLTNEEKLNELRAELEFVSANCQPIIRLLRTFEGQDFMSLDVYNKVHDLLSYLKADGFPLATPSCSDAKQNAYLKLELYCIGQKQPALDLFKAIRVFDPRQLPALSKKFEDYSSAIPNMILAKEEWQVYVDLGTSQDGIDIKTISDVVAFWRSMESHGRIPHLASLAKVYIAMPISSVDVERSFSKYGSILSPLRQSLSEEHLRAYSAVFYNNA
jgi:hypothetical protein